MTLVTHNTYTCYASIIKNKYDKCRLIGDPVSFAKYVEQTTGEKTKVLKNNTVVYKIGEHRVQINDNGNIHIKPVEGNVDAPFKAAHELLRNAHDHIDTFIMNIMRYNKKEEPKEIIFVGSFINIGMFKNLVMDGEVKGLEINEKQQKKVTYKDSVKVNIKPNCITLEHTNTLKKTIPETAKEIYKWLIDSGYVTGNIDQVRKTPGKNTFTIPGATINYKDIKNCNVIKTKKNTFKNQVCLRMPTDGRNVSVKLFNNSQLHITGCRDMEMCHDVAKRMAKIINKYCGLQTTDNPVITIINIPSKSSVPGYVRFNVLEQVIKTNNYEGEVRFKHSDKTREMGGLMLEANTAAGKRISINIFNTGIYLINGGTTHEEIQYYADAVYKVVTETEGVLVKAPKELYSYKLGLSPDGRFIINTYLKGKLVA